MRKTALILAGLLVVSAAAFAGTAPAGDMSKDKGTAAAPAGDKGMDKGMDKKPMAKVEKTCGELTAVDDAAKKGSLKTKDGKDWGFTWDDKTVVAPKGQKMEVGRHACVTHAKDSDLATKIGLAPMKKPAPAKKG